MWTYCLMGTVCVWDDGHFLKENGGDGGRALWMNLTPWIVPLKMVHFFCCVYFTTIKRSTKRPALLGKMGWGEAPGQSGRLVCREENGAAMVGAGGGDGDWEITGTRGNRGNSCLLASQSHEAQLRFLPFTSVRFSRILSANSLILALNRLSGSLLLAGNNLWLRQERSWGPVKQPGDSKFAAVGF